jgi:hypothetical protein
MTYRVTRGGLGVMALCAMAFAIPVQAADEKLGIAVAGDKIT